MSIRLPLQRLVDLLARYGHWVSATLHFGAAFLFVDFREVFEIDYDEGFNLALAALFAVGEPIYTSIWSDQPPLLTILLAGVQKLFPWDVNAARILILAATSGMVGCIHAAAARIASDGQPAGETRVPRLLAGFGAATLFVSTDRIIRISFAVDTGTPAVTLSTAAACALVYAWDDLRPRWLFASGALLALACGSKLFVAFLLPVFLISIVVARPLKSLLQKGKSRVAPGLCWWSSGFLAGLAVVFGPMISPEMMEQLVMPHLQSQTGRSPLLAEAAFLPDRAVYLLVLVGLPALWITGRRTALPFVMWLTAGTIVLHLLPEIHSSYHLLVLVPAVVLAGAALGSLAARKGRYRRLFQGATLGMGIALLAFALPRLNMPEHWRTGAEPGLFRDAMRPLEGYEGHWMATSRQTLAFRAGLLVPPELAVTSRKRFTSTGLDAGQVLHAIGKHRVAFVFEDWRWPRSLRKELSRRIQADYCVIMGLPQVRLWQRRDLAESNQCIQESASAPQP